MQFISQTEARRYSDYMLAFLYDENPLIDLFIDETQLPNSELTISEFAKLYLYQHRKSDLSNKREAVKIKNNKAKLARVEITDKPLILV
jgi:hypothetical protein